VLSGEHSSAHPAYDQRAIREERTVQRANGTSCVRPVFHRHDADRARVARLAIHDDLHASDFAVFGEAIPQLRRAHVEREIAYVHDIIHDLPRSSRSRASSSFVH
jgi:hypothetical protein